jgi:hypothetical protein
MLRKERLVMIDLQVAEPFPRTETRAIVSVIANPDENHNEALSEAWLRVSCNLAFPVERDIAVQRDIAKLPGMATTGFHLNRGAPVSDLRTSPTCIGVRRLSKKSLDSLCPKESC